MPSYCQPSPFLIVPWLSSIFKSKLTDWCKSNCCQWNNNGNSCARDFLNLAEHCKYWNWTIVIITRQFCSPMQCSYYDNSPCWWKTLLMFGCSFQNANARVEVFPIGKRIIINPHVSSKRLMNNWQIYKHEKFFSFFVINVFLFGLSFKLPWWQPCWKLFFKCMI